ncbi:MAG: glycosyltransferase family 4 protein [Acidimicrobiales bacterium]
MTSEPSAVTVVAEQLRRRVPGGIGTYCHGLLLGLRSIPGAERPPITLLASRSRSSTDPLGELGWPLRTSPLPAPLVTRMWERGLAGGVRPVSPGVLHATSLAAPPPGKDPLVVTVHDLAWRRFPEAYPRRGRRWHEAALRRAASQAALFVVPSELTAVELVSSDLGIGRERVRVVEHGVDHLAVPDLDAASAVLRRLGLDPGEGYLLSLSTLEPRKNLSRLIAGYTAVRGELDRPWPLVVVGPEGWGTGLSASPGVLLAGKVSGGALSGLLSMARCMAYVPLLEGFGLPVAEAMALGAPVVASTGLPASAGAAREVDPLDPAAIGAALLQVSTDGPEREQLVESGRRRAASLSWTASARRHIDAWREAG